MFFKTDSPKLTMFFKLNPKAENRGSDFGVFINGKLHKSYVFWKNHGSEFKIEIDSGCSEMKDYEITLPSFSSPQFVEMEIAKGSKLEKIKDANQKIYVAVGDSIQAWTVARSKTVRRKRTGAHATRATPTESKS